MGAWLDVAAALRDESAAPGSGLREAMAAHRDADRRSSSRPCRDLARPNGRALSEPMVERVRALSRWPLTDAPSADRPPTPSGRAPAGRADRGGRRGRCRAARAGARGEGPRGGAARGARASGRPSVEAEREAERRAALMQRVEEARDAHERLAADARGARRGRPRRRPSGSRRRSARCTAGSPRPRPRSEAARDAVQAAERRGARARDRSPRSCAGRAARRVPGMTYVARRRPLRHDALPPLRPQRPPAARRLARPVAQLRRRPAARATSARSSAAPSTSASPTSTSPTTTARRPARRRRTSAASWRPTCAATATS